MENTFDTRPALLLVNLGTPAAPTAQAVSTYLQEFLSDPYVVQLPRLVWQPLLRYVILPRRSPVVAKKYAGIWMQGGSPLAVYTAGLAEAMQQHVPDWQVHPAMRYGVPALRDVMQKLRQQGVDKVRVLPLYPQYSTTTTASVIEAAKQASTGMKLEVLHDYHVAPHWVEAIAASVRAHWQTHGRGERLLLSFHGIPQRLVRQGDPYAVQCEASTKAITAALGMASDEVMLTFQSRFGRERWLQPYTQPTLESLARDGVKTVDVVCPGFAVDCLETLEEIRLENADAFCAAGGQTLRYIPCLNADAHHVTALLDLLKQDTEWRDA